MFEVLRHLHPLVSSLLGFSTAAVLGCNCRIVENIYYSPPAGEMRLTNVPEAPVAILTDFVDERSGHVVGNPLLEMWLVPYVTMEFPKFYKEPAQRGAYARWEPSEDSPLLRDQFKIMVKRHLESKGVFRFPKLDADLSPQTAPLFEISGTIHKTTARAHYSLFGLGLVPGLFPLFGLISYGDGYYIVDVTLECRDKMGEIIATQRIAGRTKRWVIGSIPTLTDRPYTRLQPLQDFLRPQIESFARGIHDALAAKDADYWQSLTKERDLRYAEKMTSNRIAVIGPNPINVEPNVAESMANAIRNTLATDFGLGVLSHSDMMDMLGAKQLTGDCDTPDCWAETARSLGASSLVVGTIEKRSDNYVIVLKLIDANLLRPVNVVTRSCESGAELNETTGLATQALLGQ
ncbi:MAG: hypothetical protein JW759_07100 [Candidatus Coatesbacteria bacterium]|nr:hypothetical protein [Candidatus Coatesbacteria bacterium]